MNLFKAACGLFGEKGLQFYRHATDKMKETAPVTGPLVQALLAKNGLPTDAQSAGQAAVQLLGQAAATRAGLTPTEAALLAEYVSQHVALVAPPAAAK